MSNPNIVLIIGRPNSGKSTSLEGIKNQHEYVYLNCDRKDIPFEHNFKKDQWVTDPYDVFAYIDAIENQDEIKGGIIDTFTILMEMFETEVIGAEGVDTRQMWGEYSQYYKKMMNRIKAGTKDYIILAHMDTKLNALTSSMQDFIPVKAAIGKRGCEADFSYILTTQNLTNLTLLKERTNDFLTISEEDEEDGNKRVYQTRPFKGDGTLCRSPRNFWTRDELYIDPDVTIVLDRIKAKSAKSNA